MCEYENTLVSVKEFNTFSSNYDDTEDSVRLKVQLLRSAQSVVEDYLNYPLVSGLHIDHHIGFNNSMIKLDNRPVSQIMSVTVNGCDFDNYGFDYESIYRTDGRYFRNGDKIVIEYETNITSVPPLIKTTILRIATLMLMEAGENIGLTGKSMTDGNSRTFITYTNYDKYLRPLNSYRVFKL